MAHARPPARRRRGPRRLSATVLAVVTVGLVVLGPATVAHAHGAEGEMALTVAEQTGPTTVHVEVGITYTNDDDLAQEATVTATLTGPDGVTAGPVTLALVDPSSSRYDGDVEVPEPGTWSVEVTSTEPEARVSGSVEVITEERASTTTTMADEPVGQDLADAPTTVAESAAEAVALTTADDDEDRNNLVLPLAVAATVAAAIIGFVVVRRRTGAG